MKSVFDFTLSRKTFLFTTFKRYLVYSNIGKNKHETLFENKLKKRINEFGIEMIPHKLYQQLFQNADKIKSENSDLIQIAKEDLKRYGLQINSGSKSHSINYNLPFDFNVNLEDHLMQIGNEQTTEYVHRLDQFCNQGYPHKPKKWSIETPGWRRYESGSSIPIPYPECDTLIFNSETFKYDPLKKPLIAVAFSKNYWYSWCSEILFKDTQTSIVFLSDLIPLLSYDANINTSVNKLLIGFGSTLNKAHFRDMYKTNNKLKHLDVKSLNTALYAFSSKQLSDIKKDPTNKKNRIIKHHGCESSFEGTYEFHTGHSIDLSKSHLHDKTILQFKKNFEAHFEHSAAKAEAGYCILQKVFPLYLENNPHPASFAALLELSTSILPVTKTSNDNKNNSIKRRSFVAWDSLQNEGKSLDSQALNGKILPPFDVCHDAFRTCQFPNSYFSSDMLGQNLKAEAPKDFKFMSMDISSVDKWIAALFGDSFCCQLDGCTGLGWLNYNGNINLNSFIAKKLGISISQAKTLNEKRMYIPSNRVLQQILQDINSELSENKALSIADELLKLTRGEKFWYLNEDTKSILTAMQMPISNQPISEEKALKLLKKLQENFDLELRDIVIHPSFWMNGLESHSWNCRYALSNQPNPQTPVLKAQISQPLKPSVDKSRQRTRISWIVKSTVVDYIHLIVVHMRWLCQQYGINAHLSAVTEDKLSYLTSDEDRYRASLALQTSHLIVRAFFATRFGIHDVPLSSAFIENLELSTTLYDSSKVKRENCENVDLYNILRKTNGKL